MFTVVICDESLMEDFTVKYKFHFKPLLDNNDLAFCQWNTEGKTFEEAVPELPLLIKTKKEWRAIVVHDRHSVDEKLLSRKNPFDYAETQGTPKKLTNLQEILNYREYVDKATKKALENPLMRLTVWLNGYSPKVRPIVPQEELISNVEPLSLEYNKVLQEEDLSVPDIETAIARAHRFDLVHEKFLVDGEMFNPPTGVFAISERANDINFIESEAIWHNYKEQDYSDFAEVNLYSVKTRFLVFQIRRIKNVVQELDYFKFLTVILVLANNKLTADSFKPERVYRLTSEIDHDKLSEICNDYIYKLYETLDKIGSLRAKKEFIENLGVSDADAKEKFESDVTVPVNLVEGYEQERLMCEYNKIGLSNQCPVDEDSYWNGQYVELKKHFGRFLRQPYRSIKNAVDNDFVKLNYINDYRAKQLSEFQKEDVKFRLQEEEQSMVETATSRVFDKKRYDKMLDDADKEIKKEISRRMTRQKTLAIGGIMLGAVLFGFLPLVISEFNNLGTGTMSLLLIAIALGVTGAGMIACLFYLRYKLIEKFKHFNKVMGKIYGEITNSLSTFSKYLSHACNVMREFSVLNIIKNKQDYRDNIYTRHEIEIKRCIDNVMQLFPEYVQQNYVPTKEISAYKYDFDLPNSYDYYIPYDTVPSEIEFLYKGSFIEVPINYIKSIDLRREELYD
ncbi:MAG: hypothetical protein MR360_08560 [Ruminococcus sp.]|nr:hypothetical protein [Ruminococcus sp.]MCI5599342.1 hypothetical protein [Ruminococcus sp.]MDD6710241.1 hypothetical protein [Ruminococcus sp.]